MNESGPAGRSRPPFVGSILVFAALAGVVCGLTLLFLGMRSVMEAGGSCGSGGPYVQVRPCPDGSAAAVFGGAWGGVIAFLTYLVLVAKFRVPSWTWLGWPALFLLLGWNFLDFGLNPPGRTGVEWGWLICAVVFGLMGGVPLLLFAGPLARRILPLPERGTASATVAEPARPAARAEAVAAPPARGPSPESAALVATLERLAAQRASGALTEAEFAAAKRRVLENER